MEAVRHSLFILSVLCFMVHTSGHRSHPKCTKIPASNVFQGTCYFQYVSGRGYVKRTCPSGTQYRQEECACVAANQNTKATGGVASDMDSSKPSDNDDKPTSVHRLFGGKALSILKYLFSVTKDDDKDRSSGYSSERDENEGADEGKYGSSNSFEGYDFYGGDDDFDDHQSAGSRDNGAHYGGNEFSNFLKGFDSDSLVTDQGDSNDDNDGDSPSGKDDYGESTAQAGRGDSSIGNGEDLQGDKGHTHNSGSDFFDQVVKLANTKRGDSVGVSGDDNEEDDRGDDNHDDDDDDDDKDSDNNVENSHHLYKHGYGSIYSVKGMLSRHNHYHYEDLYVNLFGDDDNDDHHDDDHDDDDNSILENYEEVYDRKLDGVLEYVGDLFDDLFDGDFDDFYEDLFDDDGYDDCFVKRYGHYFDEDFANEIDEKYDDFDDFFKNYDKIKSLTSTFGRDDDNDDGKDDSEYGNEGDSGYSNADDKDDQDGIIWSGKGNLDIVEDSDDEIQSKSPTDDRLFDFTKTLKRNINSNQQSGTGNVFDVFGQGLSKH